MSQKNQGKKKGQGGGKSASNPSQQATKNKSEEKEKEQRSLAQGAVDDRVLSEVEAKLQSAQQPQSMVKDTMAKSRAAVEKAKKDNSGKKYRVYCDGVFDLFHLGHMRMLEQAKKALGEERTYLMCGVHSDEVTHKYKGKTVMESQVRYDSVRHCKWVDEVVEDAPWVVTSEFMQKLNIDFVAHDDIPYNSAGMDDIYGVVKSEGKFLTTQRTEGISTSDIIIVLLRDYDSYVRRNLDRGYTKKEMNVGRTWGIRARQHDMEKKVRANWVRSKEALVQTTHSMLQFVQQFDPRSTFFVTSNHSGGNSDEDDKDGESQDVPSAGAEVIHHAWELCKATTSLGWAVIQFCTPVAYFCQKSKKD